MEQDQERVTREVRKAPTGIEGFDEICGGGLPLGRTTLVTGGPGSGKTIFALQTLVNGARHWQEPSVFVALEESSRQIVENASSFGWDLEELQREHLFFLDAKLPAELTRTGLFDLEGMLAGLSAKIAEMGAKRIVFDGLDVLLAHLDDTSAERREIYRLHEWLMTNKLTGIVTAKVSNSQGTNLEERYSFMQYLVDCVVQMRQVARDHVSLRKLRVLKYRGSSFFENETPMLIGPGGIEVVGPGVGDLDFGVTTERISTGVAELDTMLGGGYLRGSATLITGAPGTSKSTLSGSFAQAACERGEKALYVSFDENAHELTRNLASVGLHLDRYVKDGRLKIYTSRIEHWSAEAYMLHLRLLVRELQPRCLIIDPVTALMKGGGESEAMAVSQRLFTFAKASGITVVMTSLLAHVEAEPEASRLPISTLADTWIHVSYINQGGERNRALTIVKSRGTKHSNQVRELILDETGIHLANVYTAGGEVLMGTLRWEKEQAALQEKERQRQLMSQRRWELRTAEVELTQRLEIIQRELAAQRSELARLDAAESDQETMWNNQLRDLQRLRMADERISTEDGNKDRPAQK